MRMQPWEATGAAGKLLEGLGLRTAVDLRLLGGGPEAQETMDALKTAGISIGDRSKIRMLVGDRAHLGRLFGGAAAQAGGQGGQAAGGEVQTDAAAGTGRAPGSDDSLQVVADASQPRRGLQTEPTADSDSMSMDTLAIVLTVLVGTAGHAMQAYPGTWRSGRSGAQKRRRRSFTCMRKGGSGSICRRWPR